MFASWVTITVSNKSMSNLSAGNNWITFCVGMIIQNGWYPVFVTKSNQNNIVAIYQCLLKGSNLSTLVRFNIQVKCYCQLIWNFMMCFNRVFLMASNKILPLQLHAVNALLKWWKTYNFFFEDLGIIWDNTDGFAGK